jgi:hypothetical protein
MVLTRLWRETDSNPRSPVRRTTLFDTPPSNWTRREPRRLWRALVAEPSSHVTRRWRRQSRANPSLEPKFPASRENTGNFIHFGLGAHQRQAKRGAEPGTYRPIPYASEQGIFCAPCRELKRAIREISTVIRESRSRPLFCGAFSAAADKSNPPGMPSSPSPGTKPRLAKSNATTRAFGRCLSLSK